MKGGSPACHAGLDLRFLTLFALELIWKLVILNLEHWVNITAAKRSPAQRSPRSVSASGCDALPPRGMPRTVSTCHLLPVSVEEYLVIRSDPAYEAYKADLAHQELHISKSRSAADDRADPTRWRSVEIHFRENPVPPFLRSLVNKLIGKEIRRAMDGWIDVVGSMLFPHGSAMMDPSLNP